MPGPTPSGIPPEVPEEFAEAYRAAYEAAMEAQSVPLPQGEHAARRARDRGTSAELPERTRPIRIGTHRAHEDDDGLTAFERVRASAWFVPLLLVVLALLLVIG